jgi:6-phosphogluconolactonase (cycloisomerase 2 family)
MKRIVRPFLLSVVIVALLLADSPLRAQNLNPGAVAPAASFVYIVSATLKEFSVYEIDASSGALVPITGSPFPVPGPQSPINLILDAANEFAYLLSTSAPSAILTYRIDLQTGLLTLLGSTTYAGSVGSIALTPNAKFIYVTWGQLAGYKVNSQTGVPSGVAQNIVQPQTQGAVSVIAIDPSAGFYT